MITVGLINSSVNYWRIGLLNCGHCIGCFFANAIYQGIISEFYAFPSFVAVHGIIASADGSDFSGGFIQMLLQIGNKTQAAFRIGIASICKCMNKNFG